MGRADNQQPPLFLGPELAQNQPGLDRLAQADLVGQQDALGDGRLKGEDGRVDLVRVEVHTGVEQRPRQPLNLPGPPLAGQFVGEVLGVVDGAHSCPSPVCGPNTRKAG